MVATEWTMDEAGLTVKASNQTEFEQRTVRLSSLFTDLIAYVLLFRATAAENNISSVGLREKITSLISTQENRVKSEGFANEKYHEARRAVLSWVDEMILTSKWGQRSQWQHLMLKYYGTMNAGEDFFNRLEALPTEAADLKEVYYLCLSLGFQGKHAFGDGSKQIQELRQKLFRQLLLANGSDQNYLNLFPEAYQQPPQVAARRRPQRSMFQWYALAFVLPAILFVIYWIILGRQVDEKMRWLDAHPLQHEDSEISKIDWMQSLVDELKPRGFDARKTSRGVVVILSTLFGANETSLNEGERQKIEEIAVAIRRRALKPSILVEGHSSVEGSPSKNEQLSKDRARSVADFLSFQGIENVRWEGQGSRFPFEDPARSRRVEIIINSKS